MDIDRFIRERQPQWDRLDQLLRVAETSLERELGHERLVELVQLYRQAGSDLNQARSYTASPELLDRLNQLTGRAYRFVYCGTDRPGLLKSVRQFVLHDVPATFRSESRSIVLAALAMILGVVFGFTTIMANPHYARALIPATFYAESPRERVAGIESGEERIGDIEQASAFSSQLYINNIKVSFLAFSLGAVTIIGGYWLLWYNGTFLGAVAATYFLDDVELFLFAWIGPHGALELPAIVFAGAAGIRTGHALLLPGDQTRMASVRAAFPVIWRMIIASSMILVVAGIIEGSFSQFSTQTVSYTMKIAVATVLFLALFSYLFWPRRSPGGLVP